MIYYTIIMIVLCSFMAGHRVADKDSTGSILMGLSVLLNVTSLIFIS